MRLPKNITSYDLLKSFAVIIMLIDHVGGYFIADDVNDLWWRVVGRVGFPIWFFLVGYSRGRSIPLKLWAGALILLLANLVVGFEVFPLNALVTIIVIRLSIDSLVAITLKNKASMFLLFFLLAVLVIPSYFFMEYGTQAIILGLLGYFVRNLKDECDQAFLMRYMIFCCLSFVLYQQIWFSFTQVQFISLTVGTLSVLYLLLKFRSVEYATLTKKLPTFIVWSIQFMGRRTLEIYVVHLLIFKFVSLYFGMNGYQLFEINIVDLSMIGLGKI